MHSKDNGSQREPQVVIRPDGKVYLEFPKSGGHFQGRRFLGSILDGCFHTNRDPEKHLFRVINAYGFNYSLVKLGGFEEVIVHTPKETLETSRRTILDYGVFLHFKQDGFERQLLLRLSDFQKEPKERPSGPRNPLSPVSPQVELFEEAA